MYPLNSYERHITFRHLRHRLRPATVTAQSPYDFRRYVTGYEQMTGQCPLNNRKLVKIRHNVIVFLEYTGAGVICVLDVMVGTAPCSEMNQLFNLSYSDSGAHVYCRKWWGGELGIADTCVQAMSRYDGSSAFVLDGKMNGGGEI